jgi:hypothetical protein
MSCNKHDEEMVYHFMIQDAVDFIQLYGVDKVMDDIYACYHLRMQRQEIQEELPWVA